MNNINNEKNEICFEDYNFIKQQDSFNEPNCYLRNYSNSDNIYQNESLYSNFNIPTINYISSDTASLPPVASFYTPQETSHSQIYNHSQNYVKEQNNFVSESSSNGQANAFLSESQKNAEIYTTQVDWCINSRIRQVPSRNDNKRVRTSYTQYQTLQLEREFIRTK